MVFKVMKAMSYLPKSEHRLLCCFINSQSNLLYPGNFIRLKTQRKPQLKAKVTNSIEFFEKVILKTLRPLSLPLKVFICSIVPSFERQYCVVWSFNNGMM